MRSLILAVACFCSLTIAAQKNKIPAKNYPSLLWEITGKGMSRPSYLFGTMHVSSKLVFHLSDSFYLAIRKADVVALETDMGTWQEDFSRYDLNGRGAGLFESYRGGAPDDYLRIRTLQYAPYDQKIEQALYSSPSMINSFLYRSNSNRSSDFEEDTYLDMHIYQTGRKWGKKVCGVESFDRSMQLMKEAYEDGAKDKEKHERNFDEDYSYGNLETAYRTGNLDLLDTINKLNSTSAAFDEKFVYLRNSIQAHSIDSIIRTKASLFVGVGAAHLPGQRGVIELLRGMGYKLRPIMMTERDSRHKDEVEKIRVPVTFIRQTAGDGFFSVSVPGKLYDFSGEDDGSGQQQFADMTNGSYYIVNRIATNAVLWGHTEEDVLRRIDSLVYENIPGKILTKTAITRNGYKGFDITNRTRRGDFQRYNIFATPFEIIIFKMSGNGDYVKNGTEANQFFNSIELKPLSSSWSRWSPAAGGFSVDMPHTPVVLHDDSWQYMGLDRATGTGFAVVRTDIHNYDFAEEDSFDLRLMEESFASSDFIERQLDRHPGRQDGYATLDATYKYKDSSVAQVRFLVQGPHYYTLVAHAKKANPKMNQFISSFRLAPFSYGTATKQRDTSLCFTVTSPVAVMPARKISMMPAGLGRYRSNSDEDDLGKESPTNLGRLVSNDSTGEKIYVTFNRNHRYYFDRDTVDRQRDTTHFKTRKENWVFRSRTKYVQPNGVKVFDYVLGDPKSSRCVHGRVFTVHNVDLRLESEGDTLSKPSAFITSFYDTFQPDDSLVGPNPKQKKSDVFFAEYFSPDSILHKRAVRDLDWIVFDSSDYGQLHRAISSLTWKEKKYIETKKNLIDQLSYVKSKPSADYLAELYRNAGDTVEIQYAALGALLGQRTAYAYQVFRNIMVNDPPVLDVSTGSDAPSFDSRMIARLMRGMGSDFNVSRSSIYSRMFSGNANFMNRLTDSVQLTGTIMKDLLPLISIHDYEEPLMTTLAELVDSNVVSGKDYDMYQSKFLIEARQQWKKQLISEKGESIKKAQRTREDDDDARTDNNPGSGNAMLSRYARLLMPFWDRNPAVPQLLNDFLGSSDDRLKFTTMLLFIDRNKPLPDTMLRHFAVSENYRYELYSELKTRNKLDRFPAAYNNPIDLGRSKLFAMANNYSRPDSIVFIDKLEARSGDSTGYVYFYKYRKASEKTWKIASVGLVPRNGQFENSYNSDDADFGDMSNDYDDEDGDITIDKTFTTLSDQKLDKNEPVRPQLQKQLTKMENLKHNSAQRFYVAQRRSFNFNF